MGGFGGLSPPSKAQASQIEKSKHYKLVKFSSNLNVKPPLHERKSPRTNVKPPYWRHSGDGSGMNQQMFNSKSISRNSTHPQSWILIQI